MRALLHFVLLFAGALALVALFTWPAWELVVLFDDVPFHRVGNRVAMLGLAIGLLVVSRRLRVADRAGMGYGTPRALFLRQLLVGYGFGIAFMVPLSGLMLGLGLRELAPGISTAAVVAALGSGALSGLVVAFIEESFLRGAMYSAVSREAGVAVAVASTSLLYAAIHFFARHRIPAAEVGPGSGLELVAGSLAALAHPWAIKDAFLCLAAVGVLLALLRERTGSIAACIGLHAGWVTIMLLTTKLTRPDVGAPGAFLLSTHDRFVGWLVLAWTLVAAVPLLRFYRRRGAG